MLLNYGLQVVCAAITDFYVVFVEDFVVPVIFRKMFADEVQELSADVCLYVHAVGRIKPNYVSLSVLAAVCSTKPNHTTKVHLNKVDTTKN